MPGRRVQVIVLDEHDTMVAAWDAIEASGREAVAIAHRSPAGPGPTWTVWRCDDLLDLPASLHESGHRHLGPLLSLEDRHPIRTWPEDASPPTIAVLLLDRKGDPVALLLPDDDPTGSTVFESHRPLPPDRAEPAADIPPDGAAGDTPPREPPTGDDGPARSRSPWWRRRTSDDPDGPTRSGDAGTGGGQDGDTGASPPQPGPVPPGPSQESPPPPPRTAPPSPPDASPPSPASPPQPTSRPPPTGPAPMSPPSPPAPTSTPPSGDTSATGDTARGDTTSRDTTSGSEVDLHPHLVAPARVDSGARATITIGVGARPQPDLGSSEAMTFAATPTGEVLLEVLVVAERFTVHGARQQLRVPADDPDVARLTVTIDADDVDTPTTTRIEVQYGQAGTTVGRAWREVVIAPVGADVATPDRGGAVPVASGSGQAPDLTVMAVAGRDDATMLWTFFSPHDVALPDDAVAWTVPADSARDFALQQVLKMARATTSPLSDEEMTGISRVVADALPPAFWEVLAAVAGAVTATGVGPASILLVTDEPWVPWELAATDGDYLPPEVVDADHPAFLGAQFAMGRWLVPQRRGRVESPTLPPPDAHPVTGLALVVGDYAASVNYRPLPEAEAEADTIDSRYPCSRWVATSEQMGRLLSNELDGGAADVLHMACHGAVDPANTQWSGIVLSDDEDHLSPVMIRGSVLPRARRPLVFLNACQVGQGTDGLSDSGSLGAAFVREGAAGFIAPLWEVDDTVASQLAVDFYRDTLDERLPVGEALRRCRQQWTATTPTRLAYVYWGHPRLQLDLQDHG